MATAVWKYPAHIDGAWAVQMPEGAKVIRFAMQDGDPRMWAHVDPAAPLRGRAFRVYGTGHSIPNNAVHLGSLNDGPWVWHLFELPL